MIKHIKKLIIKEDRIKYFKYRVKYYFEFFQLGDFELTFTETKDDDVRGEAWWHDFNTSSNVVTVCYNKKWINKKQTTREEIDKVAFHETIEILLSELQAVARERFIVDRDIVSATHRIIRRLENSVFKLIKNK